MSLLKKLKGTGVAVVTPFKKDLSIDFDAIKNIVDYLVNNGITVSYTHLTLPTICSV